MTDEKLPAEHAVNFLKYCPHCGSNRFKAQSLKELKCEECGFRFFTNSAAAVALIIENARGEIMLTRRAEDPWRGMLDLPGGFVDPGEALEDAARREIAEELGIEIDTLTYIGSSPNKYIFSKYLIETTDAGFVATTHADLSAIRPMDDVSAIEWYAPHQVPMQEIGGESIKRIIRKYIDLKR